MSTFPRSRAIEEIRAERHRQVAEEGYTAAHDDHHDRGEMAQAAAACAVAAWYMAMGGALPELPVEIWPADWGPMVKLPNQRRALVVAAALIVAELERLDRAEATA